MLRRLEIHTQMTGRQEGSQTSAKPALHSEFTTGLPGTGLGCSMESSGERIQEELDNPTTE